MIDKDGDGAISLEEFKDMMKKFGGNLTNEELQSLISEHDMDKSGQIEFEEFIEMVRKMKADEGEGGKEDTMRAAFSAFDQDGNGTISATEMREVMIKLGQDLTDEQIKEMISEADVDGDGQINYKGRCLVG
ncbi:hypothetical protein LSH36_98g04005 [Paralvinella palmiformis]|uniref:EF-hand domain-containing protein n=1 Tax=Paralvinella palmiformis TaxID=53620 RepID=A0AAD9NBU7_9ANNE|nr:hypothetical protein LSH36_98g04005 [Paralvinella palmiformis]